MKTACGNTNTLNFDAFVLLLAYICVPSSLVGMGALFTVGMYALGFFFFLIAVSILQGGRQLAQRRRTHGKNEAHTFDLLCDFFAGAKQKTNEAFGANISAPVKIASFVCVLIVTLTVYYLPLLLAGVATAIIFNVTWG